MTTDVVWHNLSNTSGETFSCLDTDMLSSTTITNESAWSLSPSSHTSAPYVATVLLVFLLLSVVVNGCIIIYFLTVTERRQKLTKNTIGVFQLIGAICDLLASVTTMLITFITLVSSTYLHFGSNDVSLCRSCDLHGFFVIFLTSATLHFHTAFTLSRFVFICQPFRCVGWHSRRESRRDKCLLATHVTFVVVVVTLWSCFIALLPIVTGFGQYKFNDQVGVCLPRLQGRSYSDIRNVYYCIFLIVIALIPLSIRIVANIRLSCLLWKHYRWIRRRKELKYFQCRLTCLFVSFFVPSIMSWTPVIIAVFVVSGFHTTLVPSELFIFIWTILLTEYFTFPIVETFFGRQLVSIIRKKTKRITRPHQSQKDNDRPGDKPASVLAERDQMQLLKVYYCYIIKVLRS